ncbi:putative membrane-bound dehydrogenase domain-containing protein [Pricia antarctica]|uniref:Putative membrane-bound dehydrogenase domain-containing protein n=2 Tax=Pricia antarctica TaxID=641691 RepID=A0A1G6YRL4_9FLAO|nr:putative membrane-bound dehydrogenase domain-containing protein [Pricia antarctica]
MAMKTYPINGICFLMLLIFFGGCRSDQKKETAADDAPRKIEMLFLGHASEHHNSRAYEPILAAALAKDGIDLTYTEDVGDLNTENLEKYDGVILYANYEERHPAAEKALEAFVKEGHAFIPIHCASFCFKDSEDFIDMVGGRFSSHGTGTFTAEIVDKEHPITKNLKEFSTWDETYVHDKIADDITILMERKEGDRQEPWTWVKDYGDGKVFYTAYGHDERTWNRPEFQKLIKEGILWAVDDNAKKNWEAFSKDIPELAYEQRDNIPNYEKRDPAPKYQLPLSPEASAKLIQVPVGFDLELFASEPDIINPISMDWDERGRLWVIETVDYPNSVREENGIGDDKVKILEDTDGDGKADKVTVFAENLNIPTGFTFYDGGIVVSQAPLFLFLKDTDGDDRADVRETIIDGWGTFDTHAGPSNLQRGIDNQIYGTVGYSGFEGSIFGKDMKFSQGLYRFDPGFGTFEFLTNTSNNTWGLGITETNAIFGSTANNTHSVFLGIPNVDLIGVEGIPAQGSLKIDGHYNMNPITANYRQVDVFGGFTAAAGHHFYTARNYPKEYWNRYAFVCEPTGGLVHIAKIEKDGAGYVEKDGGNLFAGADEWVSPVEAKVGPDGNVWVADWYNFIVQHNPTPNKDRGGFDAENGNGNAYINPLRDKSHGRIWRVVPKTQGDHEAKMLDHDKPEELLEALSDDNMFWRMTAQRLLVERGKTDVLPDLYKLANDTKVDGMGLNPAALHALWTIEGLGALESDPEAKNVVGGAIYHPSGAVRKAAVQILPKNGTTDDALQRAQVLEDKDPEVQLAALLYFAERPASNEIGKRLYELSTEKDIVNDLWLSKAVYAAASKQRNGFMAAYKKDGRFVGAGNRALDSTETSNPFENSSIAEVFYKAYKDKVGPSDTAVTDSGEKAKVVLIKTVKNEMKYDVTEFVVQAGQSVELVLENVDFMQHNLVIVQKGAKDKVGAAADKLAADPNGAEQQYVPRMGEVLHATALIDPQQKATLRFTAPTEPGEYPFICTFPGHWRIMQGVMKVVAN